MVKVIDNIAELDAGIYVSSGWGQFGTAHLIEQFSADDDMLALAERHLGQMGPSERTDELTNDEWEIMMDYAVEQLESAISEALPIGFSAGWVDGEFFIMDAAEMEELADW